MRLTPPRSILPVIATAVALGCIATFGRSGQNVAEADAYHERIAKIVATIPTEIGDWQGTDMPLPNEAVALLRPNAVSCRHYVNRKTGTEAVVMLIQCRTTRDMLGHFPPVCYKSNGYQMRSSTEQVWHAEGMAIEAMEYEFYRAQPAGTEEPLKVERFRVGNALILPDGRFVRDMESMASMAGDHVKQAYGAAQMQVRIVRYSKEMSDEDRIAVYEQFLGEMQEVILAITIGVVS